MTMMARSLLPKWQTRAEISTQLQLDHFQSAFCMELLMGPTSMQKWHWTLSGFKFKRHEKGSIVSVQICRQCPPSQIALQSKVQTYCSLQIASFNACGPCGFIKRHAFMIAFINGMFCQSLQCDLLNIDRKNPTHPQRSAGVLLH